MSLNKIYDEHQAFPDLQLEDEVSSLEHKKRVRRLLEERLERKRLKEELDDELEGEFDWRALE